MMTATIETMARTAHEVNRIYCESLGDMSQVGWEFAPEWQRESAVNGVMFVMANPDAEPADNHQNWMLVKEADGWVYGEVKDPDAKTHPCMVPYDQLPAEQQTKDKLFRTVILSMMEYSVGGA